MKDYTKQKIDWEKYIERRNSIFYVSLMNNAYGDLLLKRTGFGFKHQLYSYKDGIFTFYKSSRELEKADNYFLRLSKSKIKTLYEKAIYYAKKEEELVKKFEQISKEDIIKDCDNIIGLLEEVFTFLTVSPMMILTAFEDKNEIVKLFLPFRKKSRNLLQEQVLIRIWNAFNNKDYSFLTSNELNEVLKGRNYLREIEKRKKGCVFYEDNGLVFNYDKDFLNNVGIKVSIPKSDELKGMCAYQGKVRGTVCIINKPEDMKKFKKNDIIVSVNTTPSLMPVLAKCLGIVTDEGGITCHASIISRELKKTTVIGTKYATKIFKDGDFVEIDAEKGIVRKIS